MVVSFSHSRVAMVMDWWLDLPDYKGMSCLWIGVCVLWVKMCGMELVCELWTYILISISYMTKLSIKHVAWCHYVIVQHLCECVSHNSYKPMAFLYKKEVLHYPYFMWAQSVLNVTNTPCWDDYTCYKVKMYTIWHYCALWIHIYLPDEGSATRLTSGEVVYKISWDFKGFPRFMHKCRFLGFLWSSKIDRSSNIYSSKSGPGGFKWVMAHNSLYYSFLVNIPPVGLVSRGKELLMKGVHCEHLMYNIFYAAMCICCVHCICYCKKKLRRVFLAWYRSCLNYNRIRNPTGYTYRIQVCTWYE